MEGDVEGGGKGQLFDGCQKEKVTDECPLHLAVGDLQGPCWSCSGEYLSSVLCP